VVYGCVLLFIVLVTEQEIDCLSYKSSNRYLRRQSFESIVRMETEETIRGHYLGRYTNESIKVQYRSVQRTMRAAFEPKSPKEQLTGATEIMQMRPTTKHAGAAEGDGGAGDVGAAGHRRVLKSA